MTHRDYNKGEYANFLWKLGFIPHNPPGLGQHPVVLEMKGNERSARIGCGIQPLWTWSIFQVSPVRGVLVTSAFDQVHNSWACQVHQCLSDQIHKRQDHKSSALVDLVSISALFNFRPGPSVKLTTRSRSVQQTGFAKPEPARSTKVRTRQRFYTFFFRKKDSQPGLFPMVCNHSVIPSQVPGGDPAELHGYFLDQSLVSGCLEPHSVSRVTCQLLVGSDSCQNDLDKGLELVSGPVPVK